MNTLTVERCAPAIAKRRLSLVAACLAVNGVALLAVAVFLRCWHLDNIPGCNGDEAWSGVQALRLLRGESIEWFTPTGNPINVFFFLPLVVLHAFAPPSFTLLRLTPLASGLAALAVNYRLCRRAFDARTAIVSTLILALLPIDVAYSRFAWDASQSVLATLFVLYLPLIASRADGGRGRLSLAAMVALAAAIVVHPTNVFAAPLLVAPLLYQRRRDILATLQKTAITANTWTFAALVAVIGAVAFAGWRGLPIVVARCHGFRDWGPFARNYLRLFSGTAIYEFISGAGADTSGFDRFARMEAIDVLFAAAVLVAMWGMFRRLQAQPGDADAGLVIGWFAMLLGFFVVAGPRAIAPHFERYGICLIAPGALVLSRGLSWWLERGQAHRGHCAVALAIVAWLWPASFLLNYFASFEQTGGRSHLTFRTGPVEPKLAAMHDVLAERTPREPARIVCHEWWNYWPLAYLALGQDNVQVLTWGQWQRQGAPAGQSPMRDTWFVEFADSDAEREVLAEYRRLGLTTRRQTVCDYAGDALISVIGGAEKFFQNY